MQAPHSLHACAAVYLIATFGRESVSSMQYTWFLDRSLWLYVVHDPYSDFHLVRSAAPPLHSLSTLDTAVHGGPGGGDESIGALDGRSDGEAVLLGLLDGQYRGDFKASDGVIDGTFEGASARVSDGAFDGRSDGASDVATDVVFDG